MAQLFFKLNYWLVLS